MQIHKMIETSHVCPECPMVGVGTCKPTMLLYGTDQNGSHYQCPQCDRCWGVAPTRWAGGASIADSMESASAAWDAKDDAAVALRAKLSAEGADGDEIDDAVEALFA